MILTYFTKKNAQLSMNEYFCAFNNSNIKSLFMKKVILFVAVATTLVGSLASCGKSTKGKMDANWTINSVNAVTTSTSGGTVSSNTFSIQGAMLTITDVAGGVTTTTTGAVNEATFNIKKDGTWERNIAYTTVVSGTTTSTIVKSTGNWDFQGGVGEYKKNERVVFSVLTTLTTTNQTTSGTTTSNSVTQTFMDGEETEIYVIKESKKKELQMESVGSQSVTSTGGYTASATSNTVVKMSSN